MGVSGSGCVGAASEHRGRSLTLPRCDWLTEAGPGTPSAPHAAAPRSRPALRRQPGGGPLPLRPQNKPKSRPRRGQPVGGSTPPHTPYFWLAKNAPFQPVIMGPNFFLICLLLIRLFEWLRLAWTNLQICANQLTQWILFFLIQTFYGFWEFWATALSNLFKLYLTQKGWRDTNV